MDIFDWYFKQIVTQGQMDWAFDRVQDAMHGISVDNGMFGIVDGLTVTEHSTPPDKTVDLAGPGTAFDKAGQRCYVPDALTVVDCSKDEYGTDSNPPTPTFERYISVFIRFDRNLTDPALDGNNITVYTKQLESFEIFVRLGSEAAAGTAVPAPLMSDAELLVDILVVSGITAIVNGDLDFTRRADWVRFFGTVLGDRVYGTSKEAVGDILNLIESWGGALPFSFTSTWFGGLPVAGPTPPPATMQDALNAIVDDLAETGTFPALAGDQRIGVTDSPAWAFVTNWASASLWQALGLLGTDLDAHIGGAPPQHPAASITFVPTLWLTATDVQSAISLLVTELLSVAPGKGTNHIGWEGHSWLSASSLYIMLVNLINGLADTSAGASGALRVGMEALAGSPRSFAGGPLDGLFTSILGWLNEDARRDFDDLITGAWSFDNQEAAYLDNIRNWNNLLFRNNPFFETIQGGTLAPGDLITPQVGWQANWINSWGHPYSPVNDIVIPGSAITDYGMKVNPTGKSRRVWATLGGIASGFITFEPNDYSGTLAVFPFTGFPAGSWVAVAACSDGEYLYVKFGDFVTAPGSETYFVHAYDLGTGAVTGGWPATGTPLPGTGTSPWPHGPTANRMIIARASAPNTADRLATVNPWISPLVNTDPVVTIINTATGAITGSGAGDSGFPNRVPQGGLCSDGTNVYWSVRLWPTGAAHMISAQISSPNLGSGKAGLPLAMHPGTDCLEIINDGSVLWAPMRLSGDIYTYELEDEEGQLLNGGGTGEAKHATFDGFNLWWMERTTADGHLLVYQLPVNRYLKKAVTPTTPQLLKDWAVLTKYDDRTSTDWDWMGRMIFDGDAVWSLLDWTANPPLGGIFRKVPRAGVR